MVETKKERLFIITATVLLAIIVVLGLAYAMYFVDIDKEGKSYTSSYENITPEQAYDLINKSQQTNYNLSVIDCRGIEGCSTCQFSRGHLPEAYLNSNYLTLYNSTDDLLVYSTDGTVGASFCENLTGHVYGKIYNLEGGYYAWSSHPNFPTTG